MLIVQSSWNVHMKMKIAIVSVACALMLGGCISNPNTLAMTGLGAVGGGLLGQGVGQGRGRLLATGVGTILGAAVGNHVGKTFDAVTQNRNAINRNQLGINQIHQQQQSVPPAPVIYQGPVNTYRHSSSQNLPMNCSVRNNYVVCSTN